MGIFTRKQLAQPTQPTTPARVDTGAAPATGGVIQPPPFVYQETGSATGVTVRDQLPALANRTQAIRTYDIMANTDATVDVALRAAKVPIQGATYFVEPFSDQQIDIDAAEFVRENLFGGTTAPFLVVLEEILRMFEYGFSVIQPVYELREWTPSRKGANRKKYTMLAKLSPRPASTVVKFNYDDQGGPVNMVQNAIHADNSTEQVTLDIQQLIVFTLNKKGGNLEGKSLLRTAYKHWYYKDNLYKIDAIQKERHALGFPIGKMSPTSSAADYDTMWELVRNIRTNEEAGAVLPPGVELDIKWPTGTPVNVMESIDHHDARIMLNVMGQFLLLGLSGSGSRATGGSHVDMFMKSLKFCANLVCEYFNLYMLPKLVGYNFDTGGQFPSLRVRNIGETKDTQMWASALSNLAAQNLITMDFDTEQWVREQIDAPYKLGGKQTPENNARGQANYTPPATDIPGDPTGGKVPPPPKKGDVATNGGSGNTNTEPGFQAAG